MEKKFESLTVTEFTNMFNSDEDCLAYLAELKWGDTFNCIKCGNANYCPDSARPLSRKCTKCDHIESPTANTLFHKIKFSLYKAFWIVYFLSTNKKGMSSCELSRKVGLRQKTCWFFKRKVMKAMESSNKHLLCGEVEVDEFSVGEKEEGVVGRASGKKKKVVIAIEKAGPKGVKRLYAKVIQKASKAELGNFMQSKIREDAHIKTDKWSSYKGLSEQFPNLIHQASEKGKNFPELHRCIMMLKAWLRGMHHSVKHLQEYLNEYSYRFNRHFMKKEIFENLLKRMVVAEPLPFKNMAGS